MKRNKKSEFCLRHLHDVTCKFDSVYVLRAKLIDILGDQIPNTLTFELGYYEGSQHSRVSLITKNDLDSMYRKYPRGDITLWCFDEDESATCKRKREDSAASLASKRQKRQDDIDSEVEKLKEKHGTKWPVLKLRLWARLVVQGDHDSYDEPPQLPAFGAPAQRHRESVSSAISGAAIAIKNALSATPPQNDSAASVSSAERAGVSPGKAIELRMKNYEQLRYIQQLFDDSILSLDEYREQKAEILKSLKKL